MNNTPGGVGDRQAGSTSDPHAERAMAALKRAVAAGNRNVNSLLTDHDLDPLRSRDDFTLLMQDPAMPKNPFTRAKGLDAAIELKPGFATNGATAIEYDHGERDIRLK